MKEQNCLTIFSFFEYPQKDSAFLVQTDVAKKILRHTVSLKNSFSVSTVQITVPKISTDTKRGSKNFAGLGRGGWMPRFAPPTPLGPEP